MSFIVILTIMMLFPFIIGIIIVKATERENNQYSNNRKNEIYFDRLITLIFAYIFSGFGLLPLFLIVGVEFRGPPSGISLFAFSAVSSFFLHIAICLFWVVNKKSPKSITYGYLLTSTICLITPLTLNNPPFSVLGWAFGIATLFTVISLGYYVSVYHLRILPEMTNSSLQD